MPTLTVNSYLGDTDWASLLNGQVPNLCNVFGVCRKAEKNNANWFARAHKRFKDGFIPDIQMSQHILDREVLLVTSFRVYELVFKYLSCWRRKNEVQ